VRAHDHRTPAQDARWLTLYWETQQPLGPRLRCVKGVIVGRFTGWVEQTRGLPVCDAIIEAVKPDLTTGGAYTSEGDYPAAEFVKLAAALARREGRTAADIMREFGRDAYGALASLHPAMVEGMSDIASLVVEGVESESQLMVVREAGNCEVQGFFFSPAVPPDRFEELLRTQPWEIRA